MSARTRRSTRVLGGAFAAILFASSGCWIVAGLEDRTLLVGDATETGTGDGTSPTDGPPGDGAVDGGDGSPTGTCSVDDPFLDGGRRLAVVNQANGGGPSTLSGDEKEIIFGSRWDFESDAATDAGALWYATRARIADEFGNVTRVSGANQGFARGFVTRAAAGGPLYYTSYPTSTYDNPEIFVSDPISAAAFTPGNPVPLPVTTTDNENYVFLSANGAELLVGRLGAGGHRFYLYTASDAGKLFDTEVELAVIRDAFDGGSELHNPVLSPDGNTLYFSVSATAAGQKRVTQIKRTGAKAGFTPSTVVDHPVINDTAQQYPLWASADNCRLYVAKQIGADMFDTVVYTRKPR